MRGSRLTRVRRWTCPSIHPRLGRLAVCDHFHRGSVRYVMVSLVGTAYTNTIDRG